MAFFDDFGKKISNLGQTAVQKTKGVTDMARLNSAISEEERNLNNVYREIGRAYVQIHLNDPEPPFADYVRAAAEGEKRIAAYRQQIQDSKGMIRCPACGGQVTANSAFCNNCGFKLQTPQINAAPMPPINPPMNAAPIPPENPNNINCPKCGASVNGNLNFCTMCGNKFNKPEQIPQMPAAPGIFPIPPVPPVPPTPTVPPVPEGKSPFSRPDSPEVKPENSPFNKDITPSDIIREKAEKPEDEKNDKFICANCGTDMNPELKFCTVCGAKLDKNAPQKPKLNLDKNNGETMRKAPELPPKPFDKPPIPPIPPKPEEKPIEAPKGFLDKKPKEPPVGEIKCPSCGASVKSDLKFCIKCGTKLAPPPIGDNPPIPPIPPIPPKSEEKPIEAPKGFLDKKPKEPPVGEIKCPSCGASVKSDLKFCIKCGTKLAPPPIGDKPPIPQDKPPIPENKPSKKEDEFKTTFALSETALEFLNKKPDLPPEDDKPLIPPAPPITKDKPPVPPAPPKPGDEFKTSFALPETPGGFSDKKPESAVPPADEPKCPGCGANVKPGVKFCIVCGTKLTPPEEKSGKPPVPPKPHDKPNENKSDDASGIKCSNCGAKMKHGLKFCTACGAKLDDFFSIAKSSGGKEKMKRPKNPDDMLTIAKAGVVIPEEKNNTPHSSDIKCSKCGSVMKSNLLYCTVCGSMLEEEKDELKCSNCGSSMSPGLKFCTVCGSKLGGVPTPTPKPQMNHIPSATVPSSPVPPIPPIPSGSPLSGMKRCSKCNTLVDANVRFCTECGSPMDGSMPNPPAPVGGIPFSKKKCRNCGATFDSDMRFCTSCGSSLDDAPPASGLNAGTIYAAPSEDSFDDYNQPTTVLSGNMFSNDDYSQPTTVLSGSPFEEEEDSSPTINLDGQMCPNCKSMMASDMLFCTECGTRL